MNLLKCFFVLLTSLTVSGSSHSMSPDPKSPNEIDINDARVLFEEAKSKYPVLIQLMIGVAPENLSASQYIELVKAKVEFPSVTKVLLMHSAVQRMPRRELPGKQCVVDVDCIPYTCDLGVGYCRNYIQ